MSTRRARLLLLLLPGVLPLAGCIFVPEHPHHEYRPPPPVYVPAPRYAPRPPGY